MLKGLAFLTVLGAICGALLHIGDSATAEAITHNRTATARLLVAELAGAEIAPLIDLEKSPNARCPDWVLLEASSRGYAGLIEFLIYVRLLEERISIRTKSHRETPGIGDFIDTARDSYLTDLDLSSFEHWSSVDRVTGATITHNALQRAISQAREQARRFCAENADA